MKENERILNIVNEVLRNSLVADASKIQITVDKEPDYFEIIIEDNGHGMDNDTLKKVDMDLTKPHQSIYDEYYSGLTGTTNSNSGLKIVGYQIDEAKVNS